MTTTPSLPCDWPQCFEELSTPADLDIHYRLHWAVEDTLSAELRSSEPQATFLTEES